MDKELAETLMTELKKCRDAIDDVELASREIQDKNFRQEFHKILGRVSLDLYSKAMGKILMEFPDLDPYRQKGANKHE